MFSKVEKIFPAINKQKTVMYERDPGAERERERAHRMNELLGEL